MIMENRKRMICPKTDPGKLCLEGKREDFPMIPGTKVQETCRFWVGVMGSSPQSKEITDIYDCAIPWQVTIGVNQSKEACGTTASVDKMVNTFVKMLPPQAKMKLMNEGKKPPMISDNNNNGGSNEENNGH